jgi:2-oxoglutarate ferredoxin oxidoreductase subunit beta
VQAVRHRGFSLLNVQSPCVTWRPTIVENGQKVDVYEWWKAHLHNLDEDAGYDRTNRGQAFNKLLEHEDIVTGVVYAAEGNSYREHLKGYTDRPMADLVRPLEPDVLDKVAAQFR